MILGARPRSGWGARRPSPEPAPAAQPPRTLAAHGGFRYAQPYLVHASRTEEIARLEVPPTGGAVLLLVFLAIVGFFTWAAVYILASPQGLRTSEVLCSICWLMLVTIWIVGPIIEARGFWPWLVALVGVFARCGVIEIQSMPNGGSMLRTGFRFCGRDFLLKPVEISRIGRIHWSAGQASSVSGRDRNDWSVSIWYAKSNSPEPRPLVDFKAWDIRMISPRMPKEKTDAIGRAIVSLLIDAGVMLESPGPMPANEGEFTVATVVKQVAMRS